MASLMLQNWCVVYRGKNWLYDPAVEVPKIAQASSRVWIRSFSDHGKCMYTKREKGCMTKEEDAWPLECLRKGKSLNRPLDGSEADMAKIREAWQGPEEVLNCLWNKGSTSYDIADPNSYAYHACCNGNGLHLSRSDGLETWAYSGEGECIEILCELRDACDVSWKTTTASTTPSSTTHTQEIIVELITQSPQQSNT